MPICLTQKTDSGGVFAVWNIEESEQALHDLCFLSKSEITELNNTSHPQKRLELLAGKKTVSFLTEQLGLSYSGIRKDEFGKPFLRDANGQISISHSYPYAAGIFHPSRSVGIDMEFPKNKLRRIAQKFLNEDELGFTGEEIEKLCIFWAAK
jgi:phosphopantetheinyl transferase